MVICHYVKKISIVRDFHPVRIELWIEIMDQRIDLRITTEKSTPEKQFNKLRIEILK